MAGKSRKQKRSKKNNFDSELNTYDNRLKNILDMFENVKAKKMPIEITNEFINALTKKWEKYIESGRMFPKRNKKII